MNWDAVGAIGEVLGSIAVFATLGYLAIQVRHARSETALALSQGRLEANRALIALELEQPTLASILKADTALEQSPWPIEELLMKEAGLSHEEARRVFLMEVARWNYRVHVITHVSALSEAERDIFDGSIRNRGSTRLSRLVYEHMRPRLHPDVVKYVDALQSAV
jgi:hypothetical protein